MIVRGVAARSPDHPFAHGYGRLSDLLAVSSCLNRFPDADEAVTRVLAIVGGSLPLRTAVLLVRAGPGKRVSTWCAPEVESGDLEVAADHAGGRLAYFVGGDATPGVESLDREDGVVTRHDQESREMRDRSPAGGRAPGGTPFLALPLAVTAERVIGILQLEPSGAGMGEPDLAFVSAVAGLLAVALDRELDAERHRQGEREQRVLAGQLRAVGDALSTFLTTGNWRMASSLLVHWAVEETGSARGFFGVVLEGPTLRILAYEGIDWSDEAHTHFHHELARALEEAGGMDFPAVDNLFGAVLASRTSLVLNRVDAGDTGAHVPEGHPQFVRFMGVPVRAGDAVIGVIGVADRAGAYTQTERRNLERLARLAGTYSQSYHLIRRQAAAEAGLEESRRLETIGRLAGAIAHEFNNMMTVVLGNIELLLEELTAVHPLHANADDIREAAQRAVRLTHDLLAFARKQSLLPRRVGVARWLEGLRGMLERLAGPGVSLEIDTTHDCCPIVADPIQMERVLVSLVTNAREAMDRGGRVTIRAANVTVRDDDRLEHPQARAGRYVRLAVIDTGRGMDPETRGRMFDPFFTTKRFGESSGMGLATAQGIVGQTGGWIEIQSAPERGTTIDLYLPCDPDAGAEAVTPTVATDRRPLLATILVVDDEVAIVRLAASILRRRGHTVLEATSGHDAVRSAQALPGRLDLVVCDVLMPTMTGPDAVRTIRRTRPDVDVVYMSGYPAEVLATAEVPGAAPAFLAKPFRPDDLIAVVEMLVRRTEWARLD